MPSYGARSTVTVEGLYVGVNTPPMLTQKYKDGEEVAQALPPYHPVDVYSVDEYPACEEGWDRGRPKVGSFFFPVVDRSGLWLDFTANQRHRHHVAVVVSVQGCNWRTTLPSEGIFLERYDEQCPKHKVAFGADRFCEPCGFKWPAQNYISTTMTSPLWVDGWRRPGDTQIRQFFLTLEKRLGVAAAKLGDDRTFNIGVSFFLSRDPKPVEYTSLLRSASAGGFDYGPQSFGGFKGGGGTRGMSVNSGIGGSSRLRTLSAGPPVRRMEVGAGSIVKQAFDVDPKPLEFWNTEPAALFLLHYAHEDDVRRILDAGKRAERAEGELDGLPVGDPPLTTTAQ